ncbi:hypothetical protein H2509_04045 [Stappia sp. F7233]|uniref:ATP-grasp domain-containing protein n=1 Tax=Stappia albiluteola TaxID=2758565 RepID=A0A839A9S0_9HYPH|nr:hypothetical protein [Stappia albiluteola]MBA5776293.1 hypothetical protein [Stappia albiluteola]
MTMALPPLRPGLSPDLLYPADAAYMARTDLEQTRMLGYTPFNLDAVTSLLMGLLGMRAAVRHVSGATDQILTLISRAGLEVAEDMRLYESSEQAERHADDLVAKGCRLFWPYPLRDGRFPDENHLVPPALWRRLNAKERLSDLVDARFLPPRDIGPAEDLVARPFARPVFIKAGGGIATGWGYAVRHCHDEATYTEAVQWFTGLGDKAGLVVVEDAVNVEHCWCATVAVTESDIHYAGAAEQLFSAPARQFGSLVDAANPLPEAGVALALSIAERARRLGFLGLAGFDIGAAADGSLYVFDPNFRFNSSTPQVLLHDDAARRVGASVSLSFNDGSPHPFGEVARSIVGPIDDGWFVPTRLIDGAHLPAAEGLSRVTGFLLADSMTQAQERQSLLTRILRD